MLKCGTQHVCKFSSILFSDGSKCIIAQNKRSMCLPNTCHYHLFNINDTSLILTMCDTCVTHLFASYMFLFNLSMCTCTYIFFFYHSLHFIHKKESSVVSSKITGTGNIRSSCMGKIYFNLQSSMPIISWTNWLPHTSLTRAPFFLHELEKAKHIW